jgi:two-component system, NarL family, nitrate/nitrite response regulator NarL
VGSSVKQFVPTIVVEERTLLREGISALLQDTHYRVIASVASVPAIPELKLLPGRPLLAILGLPRGVDDIVRSVQCVRRIASGSKIVAIAERFSNLQFQGIISSGIDAIVFSVSSQEALLKAIDLTFLGQEVVILRQAVSAGPHHEDAPTLVPDDEVGGPETKLETVLAWKTKGAHGASSADLQPRLSDREQQVLLCIARGESNKTIARSCSITEATVKVHLQSILRKICVHNRTQAALWAVKKGLVANQNVNDPNGENDGSFDPQDR